MPFSGYKDFPSCVSANKDKDNPEAYCGKIKHMVEKVNNSDAGDLQGSEPLFKPDIIDKENRIVEAWGTVQVMDKEGQILPVDEIAKEVMPKLMERHAPMFLGHMRRGGVHCGEIIKWRLDTWKASDHPEIVKAFDIPVDFEVPGIKIIFKVYDHYATDKEAWDGLLSGKYPAVSFGGHSAKMTNILKKDGSGFQAQFPTALSGYEWAIVKSPMNPLGYVTRIADKDIQYNFAKGGWDLVKGEHSEDLDNFAETMWLYEGLDFETSMNIAEGYLEKEHKGCDCKQKVKKECPLKRKLNIVEDSIGVGNSKDISIDKSTDNFLEKSDNMDDKEPIEVKDVTEKGDMAKDGASAPVSGATAGPETITQPVQKDGEKTEAVDKGAEITKEDIAQLVNLIKELDLPWKPGTKGHQSPAPTVGGQATPGAGSAKSDKMKIKNPSMILKEDGTEIEVLTKENVVEIVKGVVEELIKSEVQTQSTEISKGFTPRPALPEGQETPLEQEINKGTPPSVDPNTGNVFYPSARSQMPEEWTFESMGKADTAREHAMRSRGRQL